MHICTNFPRFPETWSVESGERGTARVVKGIRELLRELPSADLVLINGDVELALALAKHYFLHPGSKRPTVAADLVLRRPSGARGAAAAWVKKLLFGQIDHFIHYFRELHGYERFYGIGPARSSFVHFKPNLRYRYEPEKAVEGEYVLCFGRSQRDYDTFFEAMEKLPYPGAAPRPKPAELKEHCSRWTRPLDKLPANVRLLDDDGSQESMIGILENARLVALPILASTMAASGIGVYLNSMLLGKCVIISATPGAADILTDQALFVPPEDAEALATRIREAWENGELRKRTAEAGRQHALSLGGEPELRQRTLEEALAWYRGAKEKVR
jgi:glycosyltransferase involved in cell wall biosynthesis